MRSLLSSKVKIKYTIGLIVATIVWGFSFITQLWGADTIGENWFNGIRFLLGGFVLLFVSLIFERKALNRTIVKKTILSGIITGFFLFAAVTFQQLGVMYTRSPGISAFITDIYTLLVPFAMFLFFRKRINLTTWIGVILATLGLYFLCIIGVRGTFYNANDTLFLGEGLLFICAIFFTAHVIAVDKMGGKLPSILYCVVQFITIGLLGCISALIKKEPISMEILSASWPAILYCGLFSVGVGYTLQVICQKNVDPVLCVLIFPLESVFSTSFSVILGHDRLSAATVIGSLLIFLGIVLSQLDFKALFREKNST